MKNNTAVIVLVVLLSLVLIGLLIYGFVFLPKQKNQTTTPTNPNPTPTGSGGTTTTNPTPTGGGTSTPTPTVSQQIKDLAQEFRTQFQCSSCASNRCTVIGKANDLTIQNLRIFSDYYNTKFGLTPKEEMDDAWVWCAINSVDTTLYQKLEGLELA